jgi:hypothetical protein
LVRVSRFHKTQIKAQLFTVVLLQNGKEVEGKVRHRAGLEGWDEGDSGVVLFFL